MPEDLIFPPRILSPEDARAGGWELYEPLAIRAAGTQDFDEVRIYGILSYVRSEYQDRGMPIGDEPELAIGEVVQVHTIGMSDEDMSIGVFRRKPEVPEAQKIKAKEKVSLGRRLLDLVAR